MKKHIMLILTLLISNVVFAGDKDIRSRLTSRIGRITVSPGGTIWLTTGFLYRSYIYFSKSINENWHDGRSLFEEGVPEHGIFRFFDSNRGILVGNYNATLENNYESEGIYYRMQDGGRTWKKHEYGKGFWVHDAFVDSDGNAWIVGERGGFYYSNDYGQTWRRLNIPWKGPPGFSSIYMLNTEEGILALKYHGLYTTSDNWKTHSRIDTPLDQKKYIKGYIFQDRVEKVRIWGNYIVVNQTGKVFFTSRSKINWKPFGVKILDFEIDRETDRLIGIDPDLRIVSFTIPQDWTLLNKDPLKRPPKYLTIHEGKVYVIDDWGRLYCITDDSFSCVTPYTPDHPMRKPDMIKEGQNYYWGASYYGELFLSGNQRKDWYRENTLDFRIHNIQIINDNSAILWDGAENHYLYSLDTHIVTAYTRSKILLVNSLNLL